MGKAEKFSPHNLQPHAYRRDLADLANARLPGICLLGRLRLASYADPLSRYVHLDNESFSLTSSLSILPL